MTNSAHRNVIRLLPPELLGREVTFRWTVEPATTLYHENDFSLKFPSDIDLAMVPIGLWWRVAIVCLHSHWALLGPCRVEIPIGLLPGENEFWRRLISAHGMTLRAYGDGTQPEGDFEIVSGGPVLDPRPSLDATRCATAFSGGKDSLLQTGLLTELTERVVLVTTTSPMPPLEDHVTQRRRHILEEVPKRRSIRLVEVESDYRANIDHSFAQRLGYRVSVNEICDALLYLGSLIAVGAALGVAHLFLASELEVQESIDLNGKTIQHPHFMYSAATLSAIGTLLSKWGMNCSSLTAPLHSYQVQELLELRYTDLSDLQYSCWRVRLGEAACNSCSQCLRVSFSLLSLGERPSKIGMNLGRILRTTRKWSPRRLEECQPPVLPGDIVSVRLHAQVLRSILAARKEDVIDEVRRTPSKRLPALGQFLAVTAYQRLRRRARAYSPGPSPGYCPGFLQFVDPVLRTQVSEIYAKHFSPHIEDDYAGVLARSRALSSWVSEPLQLSPPLGEVDHEAGQRV